MKKIVVSYEDVVVPGEIPAAKSSDTPRRTDDSRKNTQTSHGSSKKSKKKKGGKDEQSGESIAKKAEMMAEDPYVTESEMKNTDGGSKEKEKKANPGEGGEESEGQKSQDEAEERQERQKEVDILVSRAEKILLKAKGVFPFDFFPDTLTIDANKVNIITKTFFASETVVSVMFKEIMDVRVETALFLGKLLIDYGPHPLKITTITIPNLRRKDALKAKEIIEGTLVLYRGENIDTTKLKPEETIDEIKQIGKADRDEV